MTEIKFRIEDQIFKIPKNFTDIDRFTVSSSPRDYDVSFDTGEATILIKKLLEENEDNLLISDGKVYDLHLKNLDYDQKKILKLQVSEQIKTWDGVSGVIEFLERNNFTKSSTVIVVGGGITQDISAFACACYKRGVRWFFLPTTLLSMCDSCIGGKAGINHNNAKNQLGLFSAPHKVIVNTSFLQTLESHDIKSGLGEILKLSAIGGGELFDNYEKFVMNGEVKENVSFKPLILGSLFVKKAVIEFDEFEKKYRRSLNYGHTVGHAVEILSNYEIPHGIAVVIGMIVADKLSTENGLLPEEDRLKIKNLALQLIKSERVKNISTSGLEELLKKDKKTSGKQLNFAVLKNIGDMQILSLPLQDEIINRIKEIISKEFLQ